MSLDSEIRRLGYSVPAPHFPASIPEGHEMIPVGGDRTDAKAWRADLGKWIEVKASDPVPHTACIHVRPIAKPLSGAALAKSLGYTGESYGVESMPPCEPGYRMVRPGEPIHGPCEYWHDGRWSKDRSTYEEVMTDFAPIRVKLPTGGVVTPADVAQRILDRHPPVTISTHIMRFGKTEYRVEVSDGQAVAHPSFLRDSGIWTHVLKIPAVTPQTPAETVRALILDHLGIERIADTAKAQDAEQQRTTRTQYGPGTLGEWEVNL